MPGYVNNAGSLSGTGNPFVEGGTDPGNYATYNGDGGTPGIGSPYYRTEVGEWENSASPYDTFDQGGNMWEWNEAILIGYLVRGLRGGSFSYLDVGYGLRASDRYGGHYPSHESSGFGFRVAYLPERFTLTVTQNSDTRGDVSIFPIPLDANAPAFPPNMPVTLTAVPVEGKSFNHWKLYDPNHPGDANYMVKDSNNPITLLMMADREVKAVFNCGSGMTPLLPMMLCVLGVFRLMRLKARVSLGLALAARDESLPVQQA
jgi:hypothetical protein